LSVSSSVLNPAVTVSLAVWGGFPKPRVLPYIVVQCLGAFAAAAVLYVVFGDALRVYEQAHAIQRGQPGSEATAMVFGEFFGSVSSGPTRRSAWPNRPATWTTPPPPS